MLDQLLGSAKDGILKDLAAKLGLNANQASAFLQKGLGLIEGALKKGTLPTSALTSGNAAGILPKVDFASLAGLVGGDAAKARTGMESILTPLLNAIKSNSGGADKLLAQFTGAGKDGIGQKVADVASKVFGKH